MQQRLGGQESGQSTVAILATMAAIIVVLAAAFGVYRFVIRDNSSGTPDHPIPPLHAFTAQQQQQLHDIRDATARVREVSVNAATIEGTLTGEEYRDWVGLSFDDITPRERKEMDAFNIAWRLLHMIGPDDDLLASLEQQESEDVLGFYHFEENELVLIGDGGDLTLDDHHTLSHEYAHSFQGQSPEVARARSLAEEEEDGDPTEYGMTVSCVREGDAVLASEFWAEETLGDDWVRKVRDSRPPEPENSPETTSVPPALERYFAFDYDQCPRFAAAIYRDRGWSGVNGLYTRPPITTEQVLHPLKYLNDERPAGTKPLDIKKRLGKGWKKLSLDLFGEFDVYNYMLSVLGDETLAAQAAGGWGTAWGGVYARDATDEAPNRDVLVHLALDWDTRRDAREFGAAYSALIEKIAPGQSGSGGPTCWSTPGEYGYFNWDVTLRRTDVVISTNEDALKAALSKPLLLPSRPCPAWSDAAPTPQPAGVAANAAPACVLAKPGRVIDLVGVGDFPAPMLDRLRTSLSAEYGLTVNVLPSVRVGEDAVDEQRRQLIGERLLLAMNRQVVRSGPDDIVIGVTQNDMMLASNPEWRFAFGVRDESVHVGVVSIPHMDPQNVGPGQDDELLFARVEKMVAKYIGVLYLRRPVMPDPRSLMYDNIRSVADVDAMGDDLCGA